jgi:hypothetical protein
MEERTFQKESLSRLTFNNKKLIESILISVKSEYQ